MSLANLRGATLVDTGPLVGWFDRSDQDHARCRRFFSDFQGVLVSTWPVLTEVCHLVPPQVAPRFLEWTRLGGLHLQDLPVAARRLSAARCSSTPTCRWTWPVPRGCGCEPDPNLPHRHH